MRYVVLLLVGILIGALCTVTALNILQRDSAFPKGVMALLGHHSGALKDRITAGQCDAEGARTHFVALRAVGGDIETAFLPTGGDDAQFKRYAEQLRGAIDAALATPATDCPTLTEQLGKVGDGCKACHREYK